MRRPWTKNDIGFLVDTHATYTVAKQARLLRRSVASVRQKRHLLIQAGVLPEHMRAASRPWSDDEKELLIGLIQAGTSTREVAKRLNRTVASVHGYCEVELGGVLAIRQNALASVRTRRQVAQLFGVSETVARRWAKKHWLWGRRNWGQRESTDAKRRSWLFTDEAIQKFVHIREAWMTWDPEGITDPGWREYAQDVRAKAGGYWIKSTEAAALRHYSEQSAWRWIAEYGLPAYFDGNTHWVWSTDLDAFVPPLERPRKAA